MAEGKFITFEGPDGSGKTTVSKAVCEALTELGYPVRYTREPGGSAIAESIRDIILDPANTGMDPRCEALLYAASRAQHLKDIVLPALENGWCCARASGTEAKVKCEGGVDADRGSQAVDEITSRKKAR